METKATAKKSAEPKKEKVRKTVAKNLSASYNRYKKFGNKQYTGMQIGRGHHWHYDEGDWKETKITPDLWEISYAVTKRRVGHAPENSGVPVGTEYQWYIVSHQHVKKLNANDYSTEMTGLKFKVAHKRANNDKWSAKAPTQRKHLIQFFKDLIAQLEKEPIPLDFEYEGVRYTGEGVPINETCDTEAGICYEVDITLNDNNVGIIRCMKSGWKMDRVEQGLVDAIGNEIFLYFE
ncbi:MAG TPA: hypothetical protein VG367_04710 [Mucilaginibacter sp.]|jgi:hypothetical protein|nr:hypothetical protein [Mucilaginibacter sp.]